MPAHMEQNPDDPRFVWDANFGRWEYQPGQAITPYSQAASGFLQTQDSQNAQNDFLNSLPSQQHAPTQQFTGQYANPPQDTPPPQSPPPTAPTQATRPDTAQSSPWPMPAGTQESMSLEGPNGERQTVTADKHDQIDALTRAGWKPLNAAGKKYAVVPWKDGQMFVDPDRPGQAFPLNVLLGGQLSAEQSAGMQEFMNSDVYRQATAQTQPPPTGNPPPPPGNTPPPTTTGGTTPPTFSPANPGQYGLQYPAGQGPNGEELGPSSIPSINLPAPPQISSTLSPESRQQSVDFMNALASQVQGQYNYETPQAQTSTIGYASVPQPNAQQQAISPEVSRMLAGEGYNPATLAQMHAGATESVASAGRTELSQAKRALEQAGIGDSPAGAAIAGDVARRSGDAQVAANREIDINNAQTGMENFRTGVGIQTGIGASNMQAANAMALENANRLFSAMSQNMAAANTTNLFNTGAQQTQKTNQAQAVSGFLGQQGNIFAQGATEQAKAAATGNPTNQINYALNQAQLERQRQLANQQTQENRWQTGTSVLGGFAPNPASYSPPNANYGFNPIAAGR